MGSGSSSSHPFDGGSGSGSSKEEEAGPSSSGSGSSATWWRPFNGGGSFGNWQFDGGSGSGSSEEEGPSSGLGSSATWWRPFNGGGCFEKTPGGSSASSIGCSTTKGEAATSMDQDEPVDLTMRKEEDKEMKAATSGSGLTASEGEASVAKAQENWKDVKLVAYRELFQLLTEHLECPICFNEYTSRTRIFQCTEGHILCEQCRNNRNIKKCPICHEKLWKTEKKEIRNRFAENVATLKERFDPLN